MKITDISCYPISYQLPNPIANGAETLSKRSTTLVKVTTDSGIVGWGESYGPPKGVVGIIEGYLKAKYVGEDPFRADYLWFSTMTHKGLSPGAVAGIDIAIWDIKAKALNVPLHELLGGLSNKIITPYATGFFFAEDTPDSMEQFEKEAQRVLSHGFKAVKIKIGLGFQRDLRRLNRMREIVGPDIDIMVDANQAYDFFTCLKLLPELERLNVRWLEEPLSWFSFDAYKKLRKKTSVAIAGGESEYSYPGLINAVLSRAVDVIQPDILSCGGLTIARRIALLAEAQDIALQPHIFGGVLSLAVAVQLMASVTANQQWVTFPRPIMIEWDTTENPFSRDILAEPLKLSADGLHTVSTKPGIGVEINEAAISHYLIK